MYKYAKNQMLSLAKDEGGAALVEYGLLVGLIAVLCLVGVQVLGGYVNAAFKTINQAMADAGLTPDFVAAVKP